MAQAPFPPYQYHYPRSQTPTPHWTLHPAGPAPKIGPTPPPLSSTTLRQHHLPCSILPDTIRQHAKKLCKPVIRALHMTGYALGGGPAIPKNAWYCCTHLLQYLKSDPHLAEESSSTLQALAHSLASRSLGHALGSSYGEPQPGERYIMLRVVQNLGKGKTVRRFFIVDDDQIPQGEGKVMLIGKTTWCEVEEELGDLVGSCGGWETGMLKIECVRCGVLYDMRYHVSEFAAKIEEVSGNGMKGEKRRSLLELDARCA